MWTDEINDKNKNTFSPCTPITIFVIAEKLINL